MIDFKNDPESLKLHISGSSQNEGEFLQQIWLRIFEKFRIEISKEFNGISVELIG